MPIDDTHTIRFTMYAVASSTPERNREIKEAHDLEYNPADHHDELFHQRKIQDLHEAGIITAQDYVAVRGQGAIFDRTKENLSTSDAGITLLRRIFLRELDAISRDAPTKRWSRLEEAPELPIPVHAAE